MILFGQTETSHDLTISIGNDQLGEGDEIIILELVTNDDDVSNIINVGSVQNIAQITIIEDDSKFSLLFSLECIYYTLKRFFSDLVNINCMHVTEESLLQDTSITREFKYHFVYLTTPLLRTNSI